MIAKTSADPADKTREKLLAAALDQFGEHGFKGASIRNIAQAAGTNIALISYHFGGKEQLYQELLSSFFANNALSALNAIHTATPAKTPSPDEARAMLKAILHAFVTNALAYRDILLIARIIVREQTRPTAAFDTLYKGGLENFHKTITRLLAIASGDKTETQDAIIRAHMLLGQLFSFVFANAAICRRLGKKSLDKPTVAKITANLDANIDLLTEPSRTSRPSRSART